MAKPIHAIPARVMPYQELVEAALALRAANVNAFDAFALALAARVHTVTYETIDAAPQRLEHIQGRAAEARDLAAVLLNLNAAYQKIKDVKNGSGS